MPARRSPYIATSVEPITDPRALPWGWLPDVAFTGLRVSLALLIVWHGAQEHFGVLLGPGQRWSGPLVPLSDPWIVASVKLVGGLLLLAGLFTRPVALVLIGLLALNHALAVAGGGAPFGPAGELAALEMVALFTFALTGPGIYALDALRDRRRRLRRPPGMTVEMSPWVRRQYRRRDPAH